MQEVEGGEPLVFPAAGRVLTVSEVTRTIRGILESSFPRILVRGEVTNLSRPQSGHVYFSLVDDTEGRADSRLTSSQLPCVIWRSFASRLRVRLENGQRVIVCGRIGVYEPRGTYQLIGESVESAGLGELQRLFEELKEKLRREGLFDPERKRPLPFLPERIGLVTSTTGAAIVDILRVLYRRHPRAWVRIVPVRVQGKGAAEEITKAIRILQGAGGQVDVMVVARGGGSLEDLWAFNDERVARALAESRIPTVSAVGHEVDFCIADFVADARAQTPTKAAELLVPDVADWTERLQVLRKRMSLATSRALERRSAQLQSLAASKFLRQPQALVQGLFERCDDLMGTLKIHLYNRWRQWEDSLRSTSGRLEALSPVSVLARGYSIAMDPSGKVIRDVSSLKVGQILNIMLSRGRASVEVVDLQPSHLEPHLPGGTPEGGEAEMER
jgi:exodeoxyribonuclease VII large subunit